MSGSNSIKCVYIHQIAHKAGGKMEDKRGFKYVINIPVLFILGLALFIWGISMTLNGYENRKNLKNIYENKIDYEKLKKGTYIKMTNPQLAGGYDKDSDRIFPEAMQYIGVMMIDYDYYIMNFENIYIPIKINHTKIRDEIDDKIDKNAVINSTLWLKAEEGDDNSKRLLDGMDKTNVKKIRNYVLSVVDIKQEKKLLTEGLWVLFAGAVLLIGSKPWKIITRKYMMPQKEFNLVYDGRVNEDDMRILENTAYDLRAGIKRLESDYKDLQKE